jgi:sortase A
MSREVAAMHRQWTTETPAPPTIPPQALAPSPAPAHPAAPAPYGQSAPVVAPPPPPALHNGDDVAILRIPRLGSSVDDAGIPVLEGVGLDILNKATGHYPGTALPGQIGNFSVAGHRKTHGEPFRHLDEMRDGDLIVVETADRWYTYREDRDPFIVDPSDLGVVAPVPDHPDATPSRKLITLTTCNPWWASTQRMIVTGELIAQQPRSAGEPPAMTVNAPKFQ